MGLNEADLRGRNIGNDFTIKNGWRMYHGKTIPGFPSHPHRGFETITIALQGFIDHSDSMGAAGRFGSGDVQWMTAGSGVQHSEMFPLVHADKKNTTELFQIWLNLPQRSKMVDPHFKMLWREDVPQLEVHDKNHRVTKVRLIAGQFQNKEAVDPTPDSWAADVVNGVRVMIIKMEPEAEFTIDGSNVELNRNLYLYKGNEISIADQRITNYRNITLSAEVNVTIKNGSEPASLLLLEGKPLDEPVVQYGPFVMNTEEEIRQTMRDYGRTQFGGWPWPKSDNTHDRDKGRFAKHADGRMEIKE